MDNITVNGKKFEGFDDIEAIIDANVERALGLAVAEVKGRAKEIVNVDRRYLKQLGIISEVEDNVGYVGSNFKYAPYLEFGTGIYAVNGDGRQTPWWWKGPDDSPKWAGWHYTRGSHPHPFLQPALD